MSLAQAWLGWSVRINGINLQPPPVPPHRGCHLSQIEVHHHQVHRSSHRVLQVGRSGMQTCCKPQASRSTFQESQSMLSQALPGAGRLWPPSPQDGTRSHRWHCKARVWKMFVFCNLFLESWERVEHHLSITKDLEWAFHIIQATFWFWKGYGAGNDGLRKSF